jgi:hypothetical protein
MKPTIKINADGYISAGVDNKHQEEIVRQFIEGVTVAKIKAKNPRLTSLARAMQITKL